ncbi:peptide ABC transporter ATP-binding protein, partial [Streptomyces sp. PT12]
MTTAVANPTTGGSGGHSAVAARTEGVVKAYGTGETRVLALD